jgi:hypothetical protein
MTKSAVHVACEALAVGRQTFPACGSWTSRHDFTQAQLFALLVLRQFLRTDYRGHVTLVAEWQQLQRVLRLPKVPQYSTLAYAADHLLLEAEKGASIILKWSSSSGPVRWSDRRLSDSRGRRYGAGNAARQRTPWQAPRGGKRANHRQLAWPKLPVALHTYSHLIVGAVTGVGVGPGPSQDSPDFTPVMRHAASILSFGTALVDAGYDAKHDHRLRREELGVTRSVIALNRRNTGRRWPKTPYRPALRQRFPRSL